MSRDNVTVTKRHADTIADTHEGKRDTIVALSVLSCMGAVYSSSTRARTDVANVRPVNRCRKRYSCTDNDIGELIMSRQLGHGDIRAIYVCVCVCVCVCGNFRRVM